MVEHVIDGCQCEGKWCNRCQQTKCLSDFYSDKSAGDGKSHYCRKCTKSQSLDYRSRNREKAIANTRKWKRENRERCEIVQKHWRHLNKERVRTKGNAWRQSNIDHARMMDRMRYKSLMEQGLHWDQKNRDRANARAIIKESKRRALKVQVGGSFTTQEWEALKAEYNYTCLRCGKSEPEIKLTADHVIPISKLGSNTISNIQPLCLSCNSSKKDQIADYREQK